MSLSLKEQLLKAGLVAKPAQQPKKVNKQVAKKLRNKPSEATQRAQRAMLKKAKKDKLLNEQRQQAAAAKAKHAQIKQLVDASKLDRSAGETPYSFTDKKKIKKIYVTQEQQQQLSRAQVVIISLGHGSYELVPQAAAQKIAERGAHYVISNANPDTEQQDDDAYADYQIPDDLSW